MPARAMSSLNPMPQPSFSASAFFFALAFFLPSPCSSAVLAASCRSGSGRLVFGAVSRGLRFLFLRAPNAPTPRAPPGALKVKPPDLEGRGFS